LTNPLNLPTTTYNESMATPNRAAVINRVLKMLKKHYKPVVPPKDRSLFDHLIFSCLVEDSPNEVAEQVLAALKQEYYGWNEVRVSTIRELTDALRPLVNPAESAARLKQTLHSVFESVYEFDIESFKKQNIGQAAKALQKYNGTTPFAVAYVTQYALGGHSIPLNRGALITLHTVGAISDSEFSQNTVPGLERIVPKNKGTEIGSLLHQLGVEVGRNPYGPVARKLMLEIDPACKDRLPKRPVPKPPEPPPKPGPTAADLKRAAAEAKKKGAAAKAAPPAKPEPKKEAPKKPPAKPPVAAKKPSKPIKKVTKKGTKRPTTKKLAKRKPR
jgi:endonuclease III